LTCQPTPTFAIFGGTVGALAIEHHQFFWFPFFFEGLDCNCNIQPYIEEV
jgi:hypothetical protein